MKRSLFISAVIAGLFFFGCSKDNTIVDPVNSGVKSQSSLIKLPQAIGSSVEGQLSLSFDVDGQTGGYKSFDLTFPGTGASVSGSYTFPANAFEGAKTINVVFDEAYAAAEYSPSPFQFNAPVTANITYTGLDLSGVSGNIQFVYLPGEDSYESVQYDRVEVDYANGTIRVINAQIYHFSKYGFIEGPQS